MEDASAPSNVVLSRMPLLATKLYVPRVRANSAPRRRLLDRMRLGIDRQLTLISAPAGFGKTTILASWVRSLNCPVAWLTLDEADNDPLQLLRYLAAALRQIDPALGHAIDDMLDAPRPLPPAALAATLVNEVSRVTTDFVLALDDFHALDDPGALEVVRTLVVHQPPPLHLAIATREDPPLPLARLRGLDQLVELRAQDLRFTYEETAAFLRTAMGLDLHDDDVRRLDARVEGWAAGLQLAGLSLQSSDDPAALIDRMTGSQHFILSYLTTEVLAGLAEDVRRFLLDTAVLDRLSAPLCNAVTGRSDGAAVLEGLYRSNVFLIPLDDEHRWFRYHPLFADLLRGMLSSAEPARAARLHRAASSWYEQEGEAVDAVEHALAAADYAAVVRLLEQYARPLVLQGYPQTVEGWLRRLPPGVQRAGPRAALAFVWSLLLRGRLGEIDAWLTVAEAGAAEATPEEQASLLAECQALRAGVTSLRGDRELACTLAKQAVARCPAQDTYVLGLARFCLATAYNYAGRTGAAITAYEQALPLCRANGMTLAVMLAVANLAVLHIAHGRLQAALDLCQQVIDAADATPGVRSPSLAPVYGNFTNVLYERNEIDAAYRLVHQWLDLSRRGGHVATVAFGHIVLSRCELARGDPAAAQRALAEAVPVLRLGIPGWVAAEVVSQQVTVALAQGDEAAAAAALDQAGVNTALPVNYATEVLHLARLALLVHSRRPDLAAAETLANQLLASAEPAGRMTVVLQVRLLRAQVLAAQGQAAAARRDVERALETAEPEGFVRVFVSEGPALLPLLRAVQTHRTYAAHVIAALIPGERRQPAAAAAPGVLAEILAEPLTPRELEVLRLIAAGLTYQEIADREVVSLNTVRFHVKSIYGKLGVDKRFAAITRATTLGLL